MKRSSNILLIVLTLSIYLLAFAPASTGASINQTLAASARSLSAYSNRQCANGLFRFPFDGGIGWRYGELGDGDKDANGNYIASKDHTGVDILAPTQDGDKYVVFPAFHHPAPGQEHRDCRSKTIDAICIYERA